MASPGRCAPSGVARRRHPLSGTGRPDIADVARAFNQMAGDLARLDADRRLILAGVSHDLRTPLARLRLGVEMSPADDEEREAMVTDIERWIASSGSSSTSGRDGQSESDVDPISGPCWRRSTLTIFVAALPCRLRASVTSRSNKTALRRAITNLIDNAHRYAGHGQDVDLAPQTGRRTPADRGSRSRPGIPADEVERPKRLFTRLESARTDARGSGLGLAIVDRIARGHGGELRLLQRDGGGLRAVLEMPLKGIP